MRYLKAYILFESNIYDLDWKSILPKEMSIFKDNKHIFNLGNVMKNSNMIQVTYQNLNNELSVPSTLEIDFYFSENPKKRIDIDITWGDAMACEFYIESPSEVGVIQYTSYRSKTDPPNTVFALDNKSLKEFIDFLNRFNEFKLDVSQFKFLDQFDNYQPAT